MDTCELYIEKPPDDIESPCYIGEYQYWWDVPDPYVDGEGDIEGYHLYRCPKVELIERGKPVCNVDELMRRVISGRFDRKEIASDIDSELNSILHKRLSIDLTMGGMLKALRHQGVQHLGYRSMGDFAAEHLSFSGRLASEMMRNFDVLSKLPLTKRAYLQCEIMKSALRHTSRVMTPENEAEWLSKAEALPLNELINEVRQELEEKKSCGDASGDKAIGDDSCFSENRSESPVGISETDFPSEESDEERNGVMMHFNVKPKLALVWDFALSHFRDSEQYGGSISEFIDALLGSYLSSAGRKREGWKSGHQDHTGDRARGQRHKKGKGGKYESWNSESGACVKRDSTITEQKTETLKDREKILEEYAAMYLSSRDSKKSEQEKGALNIGPDTIGQPEDSAAIRKLGDLAAIRQTADSAAIRLQADKDTIGSKIGPDSIRLQAGPGPDLFYVAQATAHLPIFYSCHMRPNADERFDHIGDIEPPKRDDDGTCENGSNRENILIVFPASFREIPDKVREIAERLVEYALMRQALDVGMGRLLWAMRYRSLYRIFECRSIEEYAIQYCDLSKPLLYRLLKLADGLERRKNIKDAFESGLISREQAGLILKIVNSRNEKTWIDYAAHVPTATLKEEVERIARILQYDCLATGYYTILPGFRYITDERFSALSEEMQDIIRTGAWYEGPAIGSSWPLPEDDEQDIMERDRRFEEPWNYFEDVDEMLIYEAEVKERKKKRLLCASEKSQKISGRDEVTPFCASAGGRTTSGRDGASSLCASAGERTTSGRDEVTSLCASAGEQATAGRDGTSSLCVGTGEQAPSGQDGATSLCANAGEQAASGRDGTSSLCASIDEQATAGRDEVTSMCAGTGEQATSGRDGASSLCANVSEQATSGRDGSSSLCAGADGQATAGLDGTSPLCSNEGELAKSGLDGTTSLCANQIGNKKHIQTEASALCADSKNSDCCCKSHDSCRCRKDSNRQSGHSGEALSKAREIVKMPQGSDPAETFLLDILADEDNDRCDNGDNNGNSAEEDRPRRKSSTMPIRFFLPDEMLEIWNYVALLYLNSVSAISTKWGQTDWGLTLFSSKNGVCPHNLTHHFEVSPEPELYEGFLATLLREYLLTERIHLKLARNYAILKRDRFRCQVPGCRCRRNLEVHHIIWRSKGGCDEEWNEITLCKAHHSYILHDLMALRIEGTAPNKLTFIFGPGLKEGGEPFLKYTDGRKVIGFKPQTLKHIS